MRDRRPRIGNQADILGRVPTDRDMLIHKNRMAKNAAWCEQPDIRSPLNGGDAMAANNLSHLHHGLGDMRGERASRFGSIGDAFAQHLLLYRVNLRGKDNAGQTARGISLGFLHELLGGIELPARIFAIPHPGHALRRFHAPTRCRIARARPTTEPTFRHDGNPGWKGRRQIHHAGDAR